MDDGTAGAIRGLIERIVLTPGEMHATLHGDLGTIIEWAGAKGGKKGDRHPARRDVGRSGSGGRI